MFCHESSGQMPLDFADRLWSVGEGNVIYIEENKNRLGFPQAACVKLSEFSHRLGRDLTHSA